MAFNKRQFMAELKRRKEGLIVGAITGAIAAAYLVNQGIDLNMVVQSGQGLLDNFMARSAPVTVAKYKLYGVFISIGAVIGFIADKIIDGMRGKR